MRKHWMAFTFLLTLLVVFVAPLSSAWGAAAAAKPAPSEPASTNALSLPPPDFHFRGAVGRTVKDSDPPQFPQPVQAPAGAPNVVLILIDDCGYGQWGT